MEFNGFDDILRACGYDPEHMQNEDGNYNFSDDENVNCSDIPGGFQKLYPELFVLIGEVLGNVISKKLPSNVQNSFGNWLQLVGQVILTYNAQQQYFQGGPGRYFSPKYYNATNPFCSDTQSTVDGEEKENSINKGSKKNKSKEMKNIQAQIDELNKELNKLKKEINSMK